MKTFKHGGVHPREMKELSKGSRLERIATPNRVILPVSQHLGAPAKTIVGVGDVVAKGQVVAEVSGFVSVPVHASVSGTVKAIEKRTTMLGRLCDHIIIESDGEERWAGGCNQRRDFLRMGVERIKAVIRDAGVVGLGGAAFPTHVKLSPPRDKSIDTVILNGIECEPYLTCDYRLMMERARHVAMGLKIIMKVLGVDRALIGVEANKRDAFEKMRDTVWADANIAAEILKVKYPQGAEKNLIEALLHREVPPGKLPLDVGVVVHNVGTALAVYEAVAESKPLIERALTVTGDGIEKPANLIVPIGTPIHDLLKRQGMSPKVQKVILGGPMMGVAIPHTETLVIKGVSGILALVDAPNFLPGPCIRCGKCIQVCPLRGMATEMVQAIEKGEVDKYERLHVLDCVECGACAFACPAHRSIIHYVKQGKAELMALKAKGAHI